VLAWHSPVKPCPTPSIDAMTVGANEPGITRTLAEFVSEFPAASIPPAAMILARRAIADLIGVALAGRNHRIGASMVDYVADQGARPVAGIFGGGRSTPEFASLANGTCAHAVEFDDTNHPLLGHPSCSIVPSVFAVGEETGADFGRALEAYILGVEVDAALAEFMMPKHSEVGFHSTGTIGTVGAAAAAARTMGLDTEATQQVLGIAASRAAGLRINFGTMTKPLHAGAAAMNGVQAARLAARGWTAHPDALDGTTGFCSAFRGDGAAHEVDVIAQLGKHWSLLSPHGLAIKPYPSCGATHCAIDAAIAAHRELDGETIEHVQVGISPRSLTLLTYDRPIDGDQAHFSGPYTVAAALTRGRLGLDDFTDAAVNDPAVRELMTRTDIYVEDSHRDATQHPATVIVRSSGGRVLSHTVELARGKNANPLTEDELQAKFVDCAGPGGAKLWSAIRHASPETDLGQLMSLTRMAPTIAQSRHK
jgi:2-methylcitrate dehydratase PrpD